MKDTTKGIISHFFIFLVAGILFFSCKTPSILVTQEQQKGDYYSNQHNYQQAIVHYKNCLDASAKLGTFRNLDMEADICRKIAHAHSVQGQFDEALHFAGQAYQRDSIQQNEREIIEDYRMMGEIHLYMGDFQHGIPILEHALSLNEGMESSMKGLNQQSVADTYLALAQVYSALGKFPVALQYIDFALDLYKRSNDKDGMMEGQLLKGNVLVNQGQIAEGTGLLLASLETATGMDLSAARQHQSLGEAYSLTADFEQALRHKMSALDEAYNSRIIPQMVWSNMGVGDSYADLGDYENATKYYTRALAVKDTAQMEALALQASSDMRLGNLQQAQQYYTSIQSGVASGLVSLKMGEASFEAGNPDEAIEHYTQASSYFQDAGVMEGKAKANLRIADIYITQENYQAAASYLIEANRSASSDETRWEIFYQSGRMHEGTGLQDSAIVSYKNAVRIIETIRGRFTIEEYKTKYIENKVRVYDRLIRILLESGQPEEAFHYAERARARAFLDMIGNQKVDVKQSSDKELISQEQDLRLRLNSLSKMIHADDLGSTRGLSRYQVEKELMDAREEYTNLLERIKLENSEYASMVSVYPPGLDEIQEKLDNKTAMLAYWISENYMAMWVLSHSSISAYFAGYGSNEIAKDVSDCRRAVRRVSDFRGGNLAQVTPSGTQGGGVRSSIEQLIYVYDQLVKPVEKNLAGFTHLGIIPNGSLHFLPFQALITNDRKFLIEKYNIFYTPSASVYVFCKDKKQAEITEVLAMALGDLDLGDFSGLPGTKYEVNQIGNIFENVTLRFEQESTESYVKGNASNYTYIHLATHGLMDINQPLYSYLLFNSTEEDDGLLTVNEVFGLDLSANLVTLSACQTGLGDLSQGDEIIGLSRAFLYAGSPAVIVSLWSVADQPTAILMTNFYKNLGNYSPQESLRIAQLEVMKQFPSPFYWAPFQLIGRGN